VRAPENGDAGTALGNVPAWMVMDGQTETATQGMPHLFRTATELMLADRPLRADGAGSGALLVIAHPDDECMFFTPTVLGLARQGITAHVLCLSTGNFDGLGATRSRELRASCVELGVDERQTKPEPSPNRNRNRNAKPFPSPNPTTNPNPKSCSRVHCLDDPQLQDGPAQAWPPARIAALVHAHCHEHGLR